MNATVFCGLGSHLGHARSQNAAGHILGHVKDLGADEQDVNARIYQTSVRQTFHTDSSDVVGLFCVREAKEGGESLLVSTITIYNEMMARRPDLAALLFDALVNDPALHLKMRLAPGDMQFVYNHTNLHDRTGFTDWPDPEQRRHLLRLWLSLPDDRTLPPFFLSVTAVWKLVIVAASLLKERVWSRRCHPEILLQGLAGVGESRRGRSPKALYV